MIQIPKLRWLVMVPLLAVIGNIASAAPRTRTSHSSEYASGAAGRPFGLGIILGEPTGITGKYWLDNRTALDAGLAYSYNHFFLLYGDYLWHFPGAFGRSSEVVSQLIPYIGGGLLLLIQTENNGKGDRSYFRSDEGSVGLALRVPLGVEWRPSSLPIGPFVEIVPGLGLVPATFGLIEGGVGIRYYF